MRIGGVGRRLMIKIVTIEREYGSGGGEIAQLLATRLGWKLWDQLLTEEIARLANCPKAVVEVREERTDPLYYRLFKSFLRGSYEGSLNAHKLNAGRQRKHFEVYRTASFSTRRRGETPSSSEGDRSIFSGTARTRCVCFFTLQRENKVRRLLARGKSQRTKPNSSWIPSIASAPISSRSISTSNGPTAPFTTP